MTSPASRQSRDRVWLVWGVLFAPGGAEWTLLSVHASEQGAKSAAQRREYTTHYDDVTTDERSVDA